MFLIRIWSLKLDKFCQSRFSASHKPRCDKNWEKRHVKILWSYYVKQMNPYIEALQYEQCSSNIFRKKNL